MSSTLNFEERLREIGDLMEKIAICHPDVDQINQDPATIAKAPFDRSDADIVLRSSDNVDLRVFKIIISLASPCFSDLFTGTESKERESIHDNDVIPILSVAEDSRILGGFLACCYPCNENTDTLLSALTINDVLQILELCKSFRAAGLEAHFRNRLGILMSHVIEQEPARAYALAVLHSLPEQARLAANRSLSLAPTGRPYFAEFEHLSGAQYYHLLDFHYQCSQRATAVARSPYIWIDALQSFEYVWFNRAVCTGVEITTPPVLLGTEEAPTNATPWWVDYMDGCRVLLERQPVGNTILTATRLRDEALSKASQCGLCQSRVFQELDMFVKKFAAEVDRVIAEVELDIED